MFEHNHSTMFQKIRLGLFDGDSTPSVHRLFIRPATPLSLKTSNESPLSTLLILISYRCLMSSSSRIEPHEIRPDVRESLRDLGLVRLRIFKTKPKG